MSKVADLSEKNNNANSKVLKMIGHYRVYSYVSWVMEILTCGYKISLILSKKLMGFMEIALYCELTERGSKKNWA